VYMSRLRQSSPFEPSPVVDGHGAFDSRALIVGPFSPSSTVDSGGTLEYENLRIGVEYGTPRKRNE